MSDWLTTTLGGSTTTTKPVVKSGGDWLDSTSGKSTYRPNQLVSDIKPISPIEPIQITPTQKKVDIKQTTSNVIKTVKEKAPAIIGRLSFALAKTVTADPYKVVGDKIREGIVEKVKSVKIEKPVKKSVGESFKETFDKTPLGTAITTAKKTKDVVSGFFKESKADSERLGGQNFPAKPESKFEPSNKDEALGVFLYTFGKDITMLNNTGMAKTYEAVPRMAIEKVKASEVLAPKVAFVQEVISNFASKKFNALLNKISPIKFTIQDLRDVNGVNGVKPTVEQIAKFQRLTEVADKMGVKISNLLTPIEKMGVKPKTTIVDFIKQTISEIVNGLKSTLTKEEQKLLTSGEKVTKDQIEQIIGTGEKTSQEVIGKIVGAGLEKTPNGKKIIKLATEAQKNGQNIVVNTISEATDVLPTKTEALKSITEAPSLEKSTELGTKPIYHGTPEKFTRFDTSRSEGGATWFSESKEEILSGKAGAVQSAGQKLNIMERYLKPNIKLATPEQAEEMFSDQLIGQGYRGVKYPAGEYGDYEWTKLWFPNEDTVTKPLKNIPQQPLSTKGVDPLIAEAKKYKSAEEFVNSQKEIYHGTPTKLTLEELDANKTGNNTTSVKGVWEKAKGIYFTDNMSEAKQYSTFGKDIKGREVPSPTVVKGYIDESNLKVINSNDILLESDVAQIRKDGYSGIKKVGVGPTAGSTEWLVFDKNILKDKSQLTDIYNQSKGVESMTPVKDTTKELVEATKTEKDVKKALSNIKKSYEELTAEAEGKAVLSQEQRSGINTTDVATLKRIYANSKVFQEGDIETIRNSKSGELLNRVIENIQEKNPMMSEQEAFDYALNLPTKESEKVKITPDIKSLREKQKVLNDYLEVLRKKQTDLSIKQSDELYNEWNKVISAQEELAKIVEVPTEQLPIGTGKEKVSKLEAKIKGVLKNVSQEQIDQLGLSTYKQMSNEETIRKASEYVVNNPENALKVLSGEIMPPKGLNSNSIFVAMANNAEDIELISKLASLKSTAMGQNIEILKELNPDSPIQAISEVIKIREAEFEKRFKGKKVKDVIKNEVERIKKEMPRLDKFDVAKFLDEIECK